MPLFAYLISFGKPCCELAVDLVRYGREWPRLRDRSSFQQQHEALGVLTSSCSSYRAGGTTTDDEHIILYRTPAFLFSASVCFVFAAKICPTEGLRQRPRWHQQWEPQTGRAWSISSLLCKYHQGVRQSASSAHVEWDDESPSPRTPE